MCIWRRTKIYSKHLLRKLGNWHTTRLIQKNIAQRSRRHFSKMLESNGAIRIQGSVYEIQNTKRIVDNIKIKIEEFSKNFTMDDSIVVFDIDASKIRKYGNAIHRDEAIVYF